MTYKIQYLPIAKSDIEQLILYISDCLHAPDAALNLLDSMEHVINNLTFFPYAYPIYKTKKGFDFEYRIIPVKNYLIFYVVTGDIIEIHRVLYSKMDFTNIIK